MEIGIDPDTPMLLASELATNAVRHAKTPFSVAFVSLIGRPPWIEVRDWSLSMPAPRAAGPDDEGGRGFELIESEAARWHTDVNKAEGFKIVCITLKGDCDGAGDGYHVHATGAGEQRLVSARQPDLHRRAVLRAVAAPRPA
ncbi:ATP-binding protein [Kitasatospora sp. NPDC056184]|uniref:ATP-binding protein n=1 Tax=Kitasatospora sp. NPDC056184 TaxID=3345738 RepID=UPI0035DB1A05